MKLATAIVATFPEPQSLSVYHAESLAIEAFRDYRGTTTSTEMLPIFFERARDLVVRPIRDRTGQSIHVDEYLGAEGSPERLRASHLLGRVGKRMRNATAAQSTSQW